MFDSMIYIILAVYLLYYLLFSEVSGINFALKANFLTSLLAPVVSYSIISKFTSELTESTTIIFLVFVLTSIIIFLVGVLTVAKAYIDNESCEDATIRHEHTIIHASKLLLVCILTFIAVLLSPILQLPFTKLFSNFQLGDSYKMMFMIAGFYMSFVSLSGTVISYMPASKDACKKSNKEIVYEYENGQIEEKSIRKCKIPEINLKVKSNTKLLVLEDNSGFKKGENTTADKVTDKRYLTTRFFSINQ